MCRFRHLLLAAALLLASGCASTLDQEQLRLCRLILPALHPEATTFHELHVSPAALGKAGVRIDYAAQEPTGPNRAHNVTCGFGGNALEADRLDLVAVETDGRPLGDARLLYLKRFYLSAAERETVMVAPHGLLPVPPGVAYAFQQVLSALPSAAIYALLATAYSLIYGLAGRINLAFGEMAVIGAYGALGAVAITLALGAHDPLAGIAFALALAAALAAAWSAVVGRLVIAPLHARHRLGQPILIATAAVALTAQEFLRVSQGAREHWVPPMFSEPIAVARGGDFIVTVTPMQLTVASGALAAALGVLFLLARTPFGRAWRAFADDPGMAALTGVDGNRLFAATFVVAGLCAGLAGWIVAVYYGNISFSMGTVLGLKALVAAVIGAIGSVPGAFLGGICVALIEALWSAYFDITSRDIVVFTLLIVVFVLRPGGLLGFSGPKPRDV